MIYYNGSWIFPQLFKGEYELQNKLALFNFVGNWFGIKLFFFVLRLNNFIKNQIGHLIT